MQDTRVRLCLSILVTVAVLLGVALTSAAGLPAMAGPQPRPLYQSGAPTVVSYQGQVTVDGTPWNTTGYFKFTIMDSATGDGTTSYWANDGTASGEPAASVSLDVANGLFNVLLGDTGMTPVPATAFAGTERYLRVWFSQTGTAGTFTPLNPNRRIAAVPYALQAEKAKTAATASDADTVDGQHGSAFAAAGTVWSLTGNAGTTPGTHFIGTTGNQALVFKTNGTEWLRLDTQGRLGLGATTLAATLHLQRNGPVSILADSTADSYASLDLRSNGQTWQWSKRPSGQGDRLELYYHNGTSWSGPWLAIEPTGIIRVANQVVSTVGTGTAPLAVNSKTQVNNLNADLLDGQHASAFQQHYANVVIVANSGGDYTTITAALNSISGESDANRYLVKVMPGVYTEQVTMKPYVDIEGAGELVTKITYTGDSTTATTGTVVGANNAELRFLTVENTGANAFAIAIRNSSASPRLTHVTATASGGTSSNHGVYNSSSSPTMTDVTAIASGSTGTYNYGVFNGAATVTMLNVTAKASGGAQSFGVRNQVATVTMINVTATASGGTTNYGVYNWAFSGTHEVRISNSQVTGTNYGVYNSQNGGTGSYTVEVNNSQVSGSTTIRSDTSCTTRLGASRLSGGAVDTSSGGTVTCYACYDENYTNAGGVNVCP